MLTNNAPLTIGTVTLLTRDRDALADYYTTAIGLNRITDDGDTLTLGQGETALLHLREDRAAQRRDQAAGLFHTAFLLPGREDLSAWTRHAMQQSLALDGAADHLVSEAIYLQDPEGNGIEVYADRSRSEWNTDGIRVQLDTLPLDLQALAASSDKPWQNAPEDTVIGHVHLQVGDVAAADSFYRDQLGFDRSAHMPSASFYGSGGYHHHLAGNIWNSRGAGARPAHTTGLETLELVSSHDQYAAGSYTDPWGIRVDVTR